MKISLVDGTAFFRGSNLRTNEYWKAVGEIEQQNHSVGEI